MHESEKNPEPQLSLQKIAEIAWAYRVRIAVTIALLAALLEGVSHLKHEDPNTIQPTQTSAAAAHNFEKRRNAETPDSTTEQGFQPRVIK